MSFRSFARTLLGALACLPAALAPGRALAQVAAGSETSAAEPTATELSVWLDPAAPPLDLAELKLHLVRELGRPVRLVAEPQQARVQIELSGSARARVRYTTPAGRELLRSVELPSDRERATQVLGWLTVNLVRDEASELLDELRARREREERAAAAEREERERAAAEKAAAEKAAAEKAAAEKVAAEKAAAEKAAAEAAAKGKAARARPAEPAADALLREPLKSLDVALATPVSVLPDSPQRELHLQLALGYGECGALSGAALSLGALRVRQQLDGAAVGLGAALVDLGLRGALISVGYAGVAQRASGVLIGVGAAHAGSLDGAIVSAGATLLHGASRGAMLAGGGNVAGRLTGAQIAGGINIARELRGVALSPVNVQRRVRGVQIGVINVADEIDGVAIGVVSLARNGRLQPLLWGGGDGSAHLALKSIAGMAFTQFGAGIDLNGSSFTYDGGVGAHLPLSARFFLEPGVHYSATQGVADASGAPDQHRLHYLAQLGLRLGDKLDLLAGGGLRHVIAGSADPLLSPELRVGIGFF